MRWLCFPYAARSGVSYNHTRFSNTAAFEVRHLIRAAKAFLCERPKHTQASLNAAAEWCEQFIQTVTTQVGSEREDDCKAAIYTPADHDELQVAQTMMELGDKGKSDGELGVNEMKSHLSSYAAFEHFVDWFTRPRQGSTCRGRYSKLSMLDVDDSGSIGEEELLSAIKEYLAEMSTENVVIVKRVLDMTTKHNNDKLKKKQLRHQAKVAAARAEVKSGVESRLLEVEKRARQQDGVLPCLTSPLGLFVPRISEGSFQRTHTQRLHQHCRLCVHIVTLHSLFKSLCTTHLPGAAVKKAIGTPVKCRCQQAIWFVASQVGRSMK